MKNKKFQWTGFLGVLILVLLVSGCITSQDLNNTPSNTNYSLAQDLNKTFSQGGITFNYPSDWENTTTGEDVGSLSAAVNIGALKTPYPHHLSLYIDQENISTETSIESVKEKYKEGIVKDSPAAYEFQVLSDTNRTVNGLVVYEVTSLEKDYASYQYIEYKHLMLLTGKDGQVVYYLEFVDHNSTFNNNRPLMENIINTIKIQ